MQKMYVAWLNNPERLQKPAHHHLHGERLFALMGIGDRQLHTPLQIMPFSLASAHKEAILNYQNRQKFLSIRDLIENGQLPAITYNGTLDLFDKNLVSLDGLQEIPSEALDSGF